MKQIWEFKTSLPDLSIGPRYRDLPPPGSPLFLHTTLFPWDTFDLWIGCALFSHPRNIIGMIICVTLCNTHHIVPVDSDLTRGISAPADPNQSTKFKVIDYLIPASNGLDYNKNVDCHFCLIISDLITCNEVWVTACIWRQYYPWFFCLLSKWPHLVSAHEKYQKVPFSHSIIWI